MKRFLYKYMPIRDKDEFFTNPMIRATPALSLNDPFEGYFNEIQVKDASINQRKFYKNYGLDANDDPDDYQINESVGVLQGDISDLGIISLSESYNNPLMWAHYASEHKGMVVEFDFNESFFEDSILTNNGKSSRFGPNIFGSCYEYPEKVDYQRELPDFSRSELSAPDSINEHHWNKFFKAILFTKSIDWIYEQEQRIVVPLKDADSIICTDNKCIRDVCSRDHTIKVLERERDKIEIAFPYEYEMNEEMGDQSIKNEIFFLTKHDRETVHLFRINPYAIRTVYFGCKSESEKSISSINKHPVLSKHCNIYVMEKNSRMYQYDPKLIKAEEEI
ncbi:DUF2971 domain-containing protein [Dickeya zeae]|uniref:DUF2971 domain-containing protein n=1 Tax=Dickeya zeae TaxID=204042 RepID=UPI002057E279|nr:DUF2971 domain-containing protein [Dickeya zeae]UPT57089.1 DUF2971 domain-containing protein [Dickeya zeae]